MHYYLYIITERATEQRYICSYICAYLLSIDIYDGKYR